MVPRLAISECTTFAASFEEDVAAYGGAGLDGIGVWEEKLRGDDAVAIDLLRSSGLATSLCVPIVPSIYPDAYFTEPSGPRERTDALSAAIRRLAPFEPAAILCVTGDPRGRDRVEMRRGIVDGLREAADVAGALGLTLGLEGYRQTSGSLVTSIPDVLELVDEIGAPNVGVIVDTWHVWDIETTVEDLRRHAGRIVGVQVADWRDPTRSWADRVMPGDGIADLPAMLGVLDAGGYDGWYEVEIFSDDGRFGNAWPDSIWAMPADEVARQGRAKFDAAWKARREPDR